MAEKPNTVKKTITLTEAQDHFLKSKKAELRRLVPQGMEDSITESGIIQGIIDFWMAFEARKYSPSVPYKDFEP